MYETRGWDEEVMKWLAVGLCLAMVGLVALPVVVDSQVVWYITNSEVMGAAAMGASATIVAAGITKASLTGAVLAGAVVGGIVGVVAVGL